MSSKRLASSLVGRFQAVLSQWPTSTLRPREASLYGYVHHMTENKIKTDIMGYDEALKELTALEKLAKAQQSSDYPDSRAGFADMSFDEMRTVVRDPKGATRQSKRILVRAQRLRVLGPRVGGFLNRITDKLPL